MKVSILMIVVSIAAGPFNSFSQDITSAADKFIQTMPEKLKAEALFSFDDQERFNMNFVPMVRKGPTFHDFNAEQKNAALTLLKVSISASGYAKATQIMELEKILRQLEGAARLSDGRDRRDPLSYHFTIFGVPSSSGHWGWRFEGHHISLNFVSLNGKLVSSTPSFMGSNPAIVRSGDEKGKQVLKQEADLGFQLLNSLSDAQLKEARFSETAPDEIISWNKRNAMPLDPKGISYKSLEPLQQEIFNRLLRVYVDNYELGFSKTLMEKITKAGMENLSFAWAGSMQPGGGEYYRIQGPMLLIEYDNTQNDGNHVHAVVRDLTNDFAEDILKRHYSDHHK